LVEYPHPLPNSTKLSAATDNEKLLQFMAVCSLQSCGSFCSSCYSRAAGSSRVTSGLRSRSGGSSDSRVGAAGPSCEASVVSSSISSRRSFASIAAAARGEVTAEVTSAHPLAGDQLSALQAKLQEREGLNVKLRTSVDPDLLGGLVVTIGSKRIDSSIRTRLNSLAQAMKA